MGANVDQTRNIYFIFDFNDNDTHNLKGATVIQFPEEWPNTETRYFTNDEDVTNS